MEKPGVATAPRIRAYRESDASAIADLFYRAVHETAASHYDAAARQAWAPAPRPAEDWHARLSAMETFVAEDARGLAGFMTLEPDGHIDFAYVRPDVAGRGVAGALYAHIEARARARSVERLYAEASHLALRFFERRGWTLLETQTVERNGVALTNHRVEKRL
ncbi:MAG: GNAT family N-acetyltransferase [Pseudomonadales bacterium]|jgi:putative acetyltransferase|nr:GNAT family N-acetyltransferase [Pseudomonadales bacterium]